MSVIKGWGRIFTLPRFAAAAVLLAASALPVCYGQDTANGDGGKRELVFFFSPACHECQKIKNDVLPRLSSSYGRSFTVDYRDVGEMDNFKRLFELSRQVSQGKQPVVVPSVYFAGQLLVGKEQIEARLEGLIKAQAVSAGEAAPAQAYDPLAHFRRFTPLAVGAAGLVDGINPCAFTVIVFFISFLALQGFNKGRLALIGSFFIAGVFVTYLLIGLGLFGFFYKLGAFWQLHLALNWIVGGLSVVFGIAAAADAVRFARTGKTDGMILSLPAAVKNKIHSVIGMRYRDRDAAGRLLPRLAAAAFVTGSLVSLLESICTGQMYLPTIVFVLKSAPQKLAAFAYLALYNLMFIVPLAVILALSVFGVRSGQFGRFMGRHFIAVKALMAALFFALGIFLLWRGT